MFLYADFELVMRILARFVIDETRKSVKGVRTGLNIELNHPPNLERLVIDVIEANLCNQILILLHFSRSTRLAFLCTAPISKIQSKIAANFAKLNIENSIGTSQFLQENCYFSPKSRWNFVGISRMCSKISKLTEECRKFAKFWEILVKIPQLIEKFNRKVQYFNPVLRHESSR